MHSLVAGDAFNLRIGGVLAAADAKRDAPDLYANDQKLASNAVSRPLIQPLNSEGMRRVNDIEIIFW